MDMLIKMAERMPAAHYGMLFWDEDDSDLERYTPFTGASIDEFKMSLSNIQPELINRIYLHPEISKLNNNILIDLGKEGWRINTWALFEELNEERKNRYIDLFIMAIRNNIELGVITDYIIELRKLEREARFRI